MIRRVGRPGLLGTMARTAVIAGTATAVSGSVAARQQGRAQAAAQQQPVAPQAQQAPAPAAPAEDDMMAKLTQLGQMNQAGVLSDEEFAAAKSKLLGI